MIPAYSPGLAVILKNLNSLLSKNSENSHLIAKYSATSTKVIRIEISNYVENKPNSHSLFLRLILICYVPFIFKNLGYEILNILPVLFKHVDPNIKFPSASDLLQLLSKNRKVKHM